MRGTERGFGGYVCSQVDSEISVGEQWKRKLET